MLGWGSRFKAWARGWGFVLENNVQALRAMDVGTMVFI